MASPAAITPPPGSKPEQLDFYDVATGKLVRSMAIEIAPGKHILLEPNLVPPDVLPRYGICEWVRRGDGTYQAVAVTHGSRIKLTTRIGQELGIKGEEGGKIYNTMKRLYWAGFIKGERMTGDCYYLDLHSLFRFFRQAENPGWWTKARQAHFNQTREGPEEDPTGEYWRETKAKIQALGEAE